MNSYLSNAELKDKAKEKLTGHYGFLIGCTLLSSFLTYIVSVLFTNVYTYSNMAEFALGEAISFLVSLFTGLLNVGLPAERPAAFRTFSPATGTASTYPSEFPFSAIFSPFCRDLPMPFR